MYFKGVLMQLAYDLGMNFDELCFAVSTSDFDFPFSFYAFENDEVLGLFVTDEGGAEKIHVIVKSEIVYFRIHYIDELKMLFTGGDNEEQRSVRRYE